MDSQDLDFVDAITAPAPADEPDFAAAMSLKRRGRPRKIAPAPADPALSIKSIYDNGNKYMIDNGINGKDINRLADKKIKDRLTAQELGFLDLLFNSPRTQGKAKMTIDKAMLSAGFGNYSQDLRYRIARNIVKRYEHSASGAAQVFRDIGFGPVKVAQGIANHAENAQSEAVSLNALALAARCLAMTEGKEIAGNQVLIQINTGPAAAPEPAAPGAPVLVVNADGQPVAPAAPRKPLQITR